MPSEPWHAIHVSCDRFTAQKLNRPARVVGASFHARRESYNRLFRKLRAVSRGDNLTGKPNANVTTFARDGVTGIVTR